MNPIKIDPEIMGGTPCFEGTRVPVKTLFDYLEHGHPLTTFLDHFPTVEHAQAVRVLNMAGRRVIEPQPTLDLVETVNH